MPFKSNKMPCIINYFHILGFWRLEDSNSRIAVFGVCLGLKAVKCPERRVGQGRLLTGGHLLYM